MSVQLVSPRSPTYVLLINQRHGQTDRQTDDMRSQYHALHYSASRRSRGNKMLKIISFVLCIFITILCVQCILIEWNE